jgi:hypothetical protein
MTVKSKFFNSVIVLLLSYAFSTNGQEYKVKAPLAAVPATGFYRIPVTPDLTGYAKTNLSDVRIISDSNVFVPYINMNEAPTVKHDAFTSFPILSNASEKKFATVILENKIAAGVCNLSIAMSNTAVERNTQLSGSDDREKWYIIDDGILFQRSYQNTDGNFIQTISFPLSKYKYFKLKIDNDNTDPPRIVNAGVYKNSGYTAVPGYIDNPAPTFTQKDSGRTSYVVIKNNAPYLTGKIALQITGSKFYHRNANVYVMHDKNDSSSLISPVTTSTISSDKPCSFGLNQQKAQTIVLEIDNQDNPPIKISNAATAQEQQYLVAWLDKGKTYSLLAGNPNATTPQYDLSHFKNDIPAAPPTLTFGTLTTVPPTSTAPPPAKPNPNYWLWPTIIAAVIVLSLLTYRLMKDLKQTN